MDVKFKHIEDEMVILDWDFDAQPNGAKIMGFTKDFNLGGGGSADYYTKVNDDWVCDLVNGIDLSKYPYIIKVEIGKPTKNFRNYKPIENPIYHTTISDFH